MGKFSKNKVLRLYNSTLLGGACVASRCACMQHLSLFCDTVPDQGCAGPVAYYCPRGPFAADLQHLPLQREQKKQWGQKDNLSRCERGWQF